MKEEVVESIEKEIKEKNKLPVEVQGKINKSIFENILIAILIMLFFIFISLGYVNIERPIFITDLKVFALGILAVAILIFENSYKKEDGNLAVTGIEVLILSFVILFSTYVCQIWTNFFLLFVPIVSYSFSIYYVAKCIYRYQKMKKEYIHSLNDITEIIKEEKPIKKVETKKRKKVIEEEKQVEKQKEKKTKKKTVSKGEKNV